MSTDADTIREALKRAPSTAGGWNTAAAALAALDRLVASLAQAEQERDDNAILYEAKRALETHLYERITAGEARLAEATETLDRYRQVLAAIRDVKRADLSCEERLRVVKDCARAALVSLRDETKPQEDLGGEQGSPVKA